MKDRERRGKGCLWITYHRLKLEKTVAAVEELRQRRSIAAAAFGVVAALRARTAAARARIWRWGDAVQGADLYRGAGLGKHAKS